MNEYENGQRPHVRAGVAEQSLPVLVLMHFLGGSRREWAEVTSLLEPDIRCEAIDLPGFGEASEQPGYSVGEMADFVEARIAALQVEQFVLVGHSMGGKISAVLARRWADAPRRTGLQGVVLLCASPPAPEPMPEDKRQEMKLHLGQPGPKDREYAEAFVRDNLAGQLAPQVMERAVEDVLRMNRSAWNAWLDSGSKEDWAERVGVLQIPALVLAGEQDKALGAAAQTALVKPHFQNARLEVIANSAHLAPMEQPQALSAALRAFCEGLQELDEIPAQPLLIPLDPAYEALLLSDRVSEPTRSVLQQRREAPSAVAVALSRLERLTLQAAAECIVPAPGQAIAFAAAISNRLGRGESKGWRYAELPDDLQAYRSALGALEAAAHTSFHAGFAQLSHEQQREILRRVEEGTLATSQESPAPTLTAALMQRWFEDLRAEVAQLYMAHPATLAAIGYSGIADGADSAHMSGFVQLGLNNAEAWEPRAAKPDKGVPA